MQPDLEHRLRAARDALAGPPPELEERAVARALEGRRRRRGAGLGVAASAAVASLVVALGAVAAGSTPRQDTALGPLVRVVDRTFSCLPALAHTGAGVREFGFAITKRTRTTAGERHWEPHTLELEGGSPSNARAKFLIVRGHESRYALSSPGLSGPGRGGVYASRASCVPTRRAVPLSSRGLSAPVRYSTGTGCTVRGRILVRVRATLTAAARWRTVDDLFVGAQRNVTSAAVAVRAERTNAPLLFAQARATSTALWRAGSCR